MIGIALAIIGVPLVVPLMVVVFLGAFIPLIGAVLAGAIAALVALISEGPLAALFVVAAIFTIQQVEGDLLYPNIVGRVIRLHPVVILLVLDGRDRRRRAARSAALGAGGGRDLGRRRLRAARTRSRG